MINNINEKDIALSASHHKQPYNLTANIHMRYLSALSLELLSCSPLPAYLLNRYSLLFVKKQGCQR
jgi:hypothetical protein